MALPRIRSYVIAAIVGLLAGACGGGGGGAGEVGGGGSGQAPGPDAGVIQRLAALGAEQPDGPRLDENGKPLPDDYSPLGARRRMGEADSIGLVGWASLLEPSSYRLATLSVDDADPTRLVVDQETLSTDPVLEARAARGAIPVSRHAACGIDMDGDAIDEQVIAYLADGADTDSRIRLRIHVAAAHGAPSIARDRFLLEEASSILDVTVTGADLDGDGIPELVVGYSTASGGRIRVAKIEDGELVPTAFVRRLPPQVAGATVLLEVEAGQLDKDAPFELVVVGNEYTRQGVQAYEPRAGICMVWDDLTTDLAEQLREPLVVAVGDTDEQAFPIDPAVGDLDTDGMDEVVFAGIYDTSDLCIGRYAVRTYDDLFHGLPVIDEHAVGAAVGKDGDQYEEACDVSVYWVHVDIVDFEGDGAGEIHLNEVVFRDWLGSDRWTKWTEIPSWFPRYEGSLFLKDRVDTTTTAMVKGDFDGDGWEDLAVWAMRRDGITVWGLDTRKETPEFGMLIDVPLPRSQRDATDLFNPNPVLFRATVDDEATLLEFVRHELFSTEPMVLAAIAAPPTLGHDQNLDASETSYGTSTSSGSSLGGEVGFSVGFIVGSEFKQWGFGWEVEGQVSVEFGGVFENSERRTEGVAYSTGWNEDSVVCTVATFDRYVYRVIAHPNPDAVGREVTLDLPRGDPQTFQVEREYYNANVAREATRIGPEVLGHGIGDPLSYPTEAEKDDLVAHQEGVATGSSTVGQGTSSATTVSLALETEDTTGRFLGATSSVELKATAASVTVGGTYSESAGAEWRWSHGSATEFSGTVGSLHENVFATRRYAFGVLAWWHRDEANRVGYQVVTYYVTGDAP